MDYTTIPKAKAIPEAASMIETFRAIGYDLQTAIADIIDNSISAKAKNINVERIWRGGQSVIIITDDGIGMNNEEIIQALRPGAQNSLSQRSETDLGRFGLGLKTASFSQCRKLSVLSKRENNDPSYWTWDLDYVSQTNQWELIKWIPAEFVNKLNDQKSGTLVIWTELDRILPLNTNEDNEFAKQKFSEDLDKVKRHIAMTFHRFIEHKTLKLFWCGHEIEPWNPFCINEQRTQIQPTEEITNKTAIGGITMKGYVLPHKNNFSSENAYKLAEGMNGYFSQQGFYVYRCNRLLVSGDWLGLFKKEEHYKLVRIQMDLPNTLDIEWQIDIKKSKACPPAIYKNQIESYAKSVRSIGMEVYRHRGKILKQRAGQNFQPLWLEKKKDNQWSFIVNRDNAIIKELVQFANKEPKKAIETLLKFVEESIPTKTIYINEAKAEESQKPQYSGLNKEILKQIAKKIYTNYILQGNTSEQAKNMLKTQDPFNNFEDIIDEIQ